MGSWCSKEKVFQGRIQEFLIGGWGVGVQTLVQKGLLSFFTANHFLLQITSGAIDLDPRFFGH